MPVNVKWGDERETYILIEPVDTWDWAAFYRALNHINELPGSAEQPAPLVIDFSQTDHTPRGLLVRLSGLGNDVPENRNIYFVGLNATMLVLMRTLRRSSEMLKNRMRILHDRSAALRDIYKTGSLPAAYLF
jgi:hypothetical protein